MPTTRHLRGGDAYGINRAGQVVGRLYDVHPVTRYFTSAAAWWERRDDTEVYAVMG